MKKVFIGLVFLFFFIKVNGVNLLPSFVGYALICLGLREERECPTGKVTGQIAAAGTVVMGLLWVLGLVGVGLPLPIGLVFQLLITYRMVAWVKELAGSGERTASMQESWYVLAAGSILSYLLAALDIWLFIVPLLVGLGAAAYYIYNYYQIWKGRDGSRGPL